MGGGEQAPLVSAQELGALLSLAEFVARRRDLDELLSECVTRAAALVGSPRASIQVLDAARAQLIARCRAGEPVHAEPAPFALGEGLAGWIALHAKPVRVGVAERDPRFVRRATLTAPLVSYLGVPLLAGGECLGVLSFTHANEGAFDARHEALAALVAALVAPHVELARLALLTRLDPLTGLLNRRGLAAVQPPEVSEALVGSVICADLDHFKEVNDRHGHAVGDRVLLVVAEVLGRAVRRGDLVARTGGEEFVIVLPGAPLAAAMRIAESARAALAATDIDNASGNVRVTASFGVAERRAPESHDDAVMRADAALYAAKRAGRNRVTAA
jgi:diguanylate cyclase (GGDEF)-like protein